MSVPELIRHGMRWACKVKKRSKVSIASARRNTTWLFYSEFRHVNPTWVRDASSPPKFLWKELILRPAHNAPSMKDVLKSSSLHFKSLGFLLLSIQHFRTRLTSKWSAMLFLLKILRSSSNITQSPKAAAPGRSFAKSVNSNGPRTEPWGTPLVSSMSEAKTLFILTFCVLDIN